MITSKMRQSKLILNTQFASEVTLCSLFFFAPLREIFLAKAQREKGAKKDKAQRVIA